jgi:lipopolysaccharide transport system permease protein
MEYRKLIPKSAIKISSFDEPATIIESQRGLFDLDLKGMWEFRELLFFLGWRDVKVRYKQTFL